MKSLGDVKEPWVSFDDLPTSIQPQILHEWDHPVENFGYAATLFCRVHVNDLVPRKVAGDLTQF